MNVLKIKTKIAEVEIKHKGLKPSDIKNILEMLLDDDSLTSIKSNESKGDEE